VSSIGYSLGIGSGIDIKALIDGLAQAQRAPKQALIERRQEANAAKVSALAEATGAIDSFAAALSSLVNGGTLFTQPSVSDPSILSATTVAGNRLTNLSAQIEVLQLAKAQTLQSVSLLDASTAVGQGDLTLNTSRGSFVVTVDSTNDSLTGLAAAINAKSAGVTASVLTDSNGSRLVLKGATGEAQAFTLDVPAGTASGLERFAFGPAVTGGMTEAQPAQDAIVRLDGVEVRRASNGFKDLIDGVQIDLKRASPGSTISLGVTRPTASIEQAVGDFVSAYNELHSLLAKSVAAEKDGQAGGPLRGDVSIREMRRQLAQLPTMVLNSQGTIKTLAEIGVATNRDGTLTLGTGRLKQMLESDPAAVEALFNPVQYSSDPLLKITSAMGKAKPGTYTYTDLVPAANGVDASGTVDGLAATGSGPFLIAPFNSKALGLTVEVKGALASATVTVDHGLGGALQSIRDSVRARSGPVVTSQERLSAEAKEIAKDQRELEVRSKAYYDQLVKNFTAMERQVSSFKATQSYLDQQIKIWTGNNG
jgi:flagellar hook-associated protein 2